MPTDQQIADYGKQMRKKAERIIKALDYIQKKAKVRTFTPELWNLATDVAEGNIKSHEAVERLRMKIPLRFVSLTTHDHLIVSTIARNKIALFYTSGRIDESPILAFSESYLGHSHVLLEDFWKETHIRRGEGIV